MRAMEIILTGRSLDAAEALALGVVHEVVSREEVMSRALALADQIAATAPIAVRESSAVARTSLRGDETGAWQRAEAAWSRVLASEESREGTLAFAEKREPVWTGR